MRVKTEKQKNVTLTEDNFEAQKGRWCFETVFQHFEKLIIMTRNYGFLMKMRRMTFGTLMSDKFPVVSEDREV